MNDTRLSKKDKNQHIQVFVRVRPINNAEKKGKSTTIIEIPTDKEIVVQERPQDKYLKKFTFDRVFCPLSKQIEVYDAVVSPLLAEVLAGYNCTVFAYGQTGTGKTFTMEGVSNDPALHWRSDTTAGMIPRSLSHLFDELRVLESQEYTVRVSFLELYNEELFDLLSPNDDASKIRLYEDASRKGAVIIHGLEEVTVHNKHEVFKILEKGSEKRQTAATLMNAQSSRSHTVFSVTIHIKENTVSGEELLKTGKLNLVDLAGSENVGRSGAVDKRAREAGSINQSLLTLGRVITALVERAPHVPYRASKLTRLLQESLGGRTKTSIIATISPASVNLEETLSTLDYAYRAKNITNRPEINQKLSKKALLKEYTEEIERLRRDLLATREKNGVYLAHENYNEMRAQIELQGKEIEEKISHIKVLEETMQNKEKIFDNLQLEHKVQSNELSQTKSKLEVITYALQSTSHQLDITKCERDEQTYLVEKHVSTEKVLLSQAQNLLNVADTVTADTQKLHDKICRKTQVEQTNETLAQQFRNDIIDRFQDIKENVSEHTAQSKEFCECIKNQIDSQTAIKTGNIDAAIEQLSVNVTNQHLTTTDNLSVNVNDMCNSLRDWIQDEAKSTENVVEQESQFLTEAFTKLEPRIHRFIENKIRANLQRLNEDMSQKLEYISLYVKENIDLACSLRLKEREQLTNNVKEIQEMVDQLFQKENDIMHERRTFAKMMEELSTEFNELHKLEEDNYSNVATCYDYINGSCKTIDRQVTDNYSKNIKMEEDFKGTVQDELETIKHNVATETKENVELTKITIDESSAVLNQIQSALGESRNALKQYKNCVECNSKDMQRKVEDDKNQSLLSIKNIAELVVDATANHTKFLEEQKVGFSSVSADINEKFSNECAESANRVQKITEEIYSVQNNVHKFFAEDMQRDVPTGATPVRKEFSYPRQFAVTSPHERILQRFRETRKFVETSEYDDDTLMNTDLTMKHAANSTALLDITTLCNGLPSPNGNSTLMETSTFNSMDSHIETAHSRLEVSHTALPVRVRSEPNLCKVDNKENSYDFLKPDQKRHTQISKLKKPKRQVLGPYN